MTAIDSVLDGTLQRHADGWRWKDGTPEPRVRDMLVADNAPNFRVASDVVEIPHDWRSPAYWPAGKGRHRVDTQAAEEIDRLIRDAGRAARIYAEGLAEIVDDHRVTRHGYRVPVSHWEAAMREPCGVWWDGEHELAILDRACALGWRPPAGYISPQGWTRHTW